MRQFNYNKVVDSNRLKQEIEQSTITVALDRIETSSLPDVKIYFKADLSESEISFLNNLVSSHVNTPLPDDEIKNVKVTADVRSTPFAAKTVDGFSLFRRKHGYSMEITGGQEGTIEITIEYVRCKIDKMEIVGQAVGDTADLTVHDNDQGTISKTGTPFQLLNQFGFGVVLPANFYEDKSDYDADLYKGMVVRVKVKNNTNEPRIYGVNFALHELKL